MIIDLSYFDRWVIAPYAICLFGSVLIGLVYIAVRIKYSGIKTEYIMYILFLELISHSAVREFSCVGDDSKKLRARQDLPALAEPQECFLGFG